MEWQGQIKKIEKKFSTGSGRSWAFSIVCPHRAPDAQSGQHVNVVDSGREYRLVDYPADPVGKVLRLGLDPLELSRVVVTHAHRTLSAALGTPEAKFVSGWAFMRFRQAKIDS